MKTPNGKIGRLPANIQLEVNLRLLDGWGGPELLTWLNGLPAVREVLDRKFGGREINHQNLTGWRQGGYREWKFRRDLFMAAIDHSAEKAQSVPSSTPAVQSKAENSVQTNEILPHAPGCAWGVGNHELQAAHSRSRELEKGRLTVKYTKARKILQGTKGFVFSCIRRFVTRISCHK